MLSGVVAGLPNPPAREVRVAGSDVYSPQTGKVISAEEALASAALTPQSNPVEVMMQHGQPVVVKDANGLFVAALPVLQNGEAVIEEGRVKMSSIATASKGRSETLQQLANRLAAKASTKAAPVTPVDHTFFVEIPVERFPIASSKVVEQTLRYSVPVVSLLTGKATARAQLNTDPAAVIGRAGVADWVGRLTKAFPKVQVKIVSTEEMTRMGFASASQVGVDGVVYINEDSANADTPAHEYGHVYASVMKAYFPSLWQRGQDLAGQTTELIDSLRQTYPGYSEAQLREEALATLIGQQATTVTIRPSLLTQIQGWIATTMNRIGEAIGMDLRNETTLAQFVAGRTQELLAGSTISNATSTDIAGIESAGSAISSGRTGAEALRTQMDKLVKSGGMTAEEANLVRWVLDQNPNVAETLRLSGWLEEKEETGGEYMPGARLIQLMKERTTDTLLHEVLHHTERMLPAAVQDAIRQAHEAAVQRAAQSSDPLVAEVARQIQAGNRQGAVRSLSSSNELGNRDLYQLLDESEYWAVNATALLSKRFEANNSIWQAAHQWLTDLANKVRAMLKLPLRGEVGDPVIASAVDVLLEQADGTFISPLIARRFQGFYAPPRPSAPIGKHMMESHLLRYDLDKQQAKDYQSRDLDIDANRGQYVSSTINAAAEVADVKANVAQMKQSKITETLLKVAGTLEIGKLLDLTLGANSETTLRMKRLLDHQAGVVARMNVAAFGHMKAYHQLLDGKTTFRGAMTDAAVERWQMPAKYGTLDESVDTMIDIAATFRTVMAQHGFIDVRWKKAANIAAAAGTAPPSPNTQEMRIELPNRDNPELPRSVILTYPQVSAIADRVFNQDATTSAVMAQWELHNQDTWPPLSRVYRMVMGKELARQKWYYPLTAAGVRDRQLNEREFETFVDDVGLV
ncbi:MAG: hypothetical protein EOO81_02900, partial [Oxalobacteraceae bacterium]